jgi:hypothetical protein
VVIFAHDEIITEMPEDRARRGGVAASRDHDRGNAGSASRDVKVSAEPALMRFWYKDAKLEERRERKADPVGALEEIECDVAFCCGLGGDGDDACYHCKQKLELINMLHAQCGWAFDLGVLQGVFGC